jgi:tetratricopeptide (TPR) repeat protein
MTGKFSNNPYYVEYESLLKQLHRLIATGNGNSEEADAVRDEMDRPERELSSEELTRLNGLSADLYMLQGDEVFERPGEDPWTPQQLAAHLKSAWTREDWEGVLQLLRQGPTFIDRDRIAYMRAWAYSELGHPDTSLLFMEYAADLNPREPQYRLQLIEQLSQLGRHAEARERVDEYIQDDSSSPALLIKAASVLFRAARASDRETASPVYEQAIQLLRRALPTASDALPDVVASGYLTLGLCYEALGQLESADGAYSTVLERDRVDGTATDPHGIALVARALLRMASDPAAAIADFQSAADLDAPAVAPYVYLANRALRSGDYNACVKLCDKIVSKTQKPSVLAVALQWVAIARFELGKPHDVVRRTFHAALTFDPLSEQIQHNLQFFEQVAGAAPGAVAYAAHWEVNLSLDPALMAPAGGEVPPVSMAA